MGISRREFLRGTVLTAAASLALSFRARGLSEEDLDRLQHELEGSSKHFVPESYNTEKVGDLFVAKTKVRESTEGEIFVPYQKGTIIADIDGYSIGHVHPYWRTGWSSYAIVPDGSEEEKRMHQLTKKRSKERASQQNRAHPIIQKV